MHTLTQASENSGLWILFGVIEQTLIRRCRRDKMCTTEVSARHNLFDTATEENKYTCLNLCVYVPVQKDHLHESSLMRKCDTLYWRVCTRHFPHFSGRTSSARGAVTIRGCIRLLYCIIQTNEQTTITFNLFDTCTSNQSQVDL